MTLTRAARWLLIAAIAWGAFAFGAVYPWAYWPLAIAALAVALAGIFAPAPRGWQRLDLAGLTLALGALILAAAIQLVPLPYATVSSISPEAPSIIAQLDPAAGLGLGPRHPLSIAPANTLAGLGVIASLALLVVGAARLLSISGAASMARAITVIGVLLALTGIIQQPLFTGKIYGFWAPMQGGSPYGPFVNKNHFAGWMLMGLPVTLGLLLGGVARGMRGARPGLREKVLWLSSPDASSLILLLGAAGIMALSLILTMSRSGMLAAALVLVVTGVWALRGYRTTAHKLAGIALLSVLILAAIGWAGTTAIANRFSSGSTTDLSGRVDVWEDALRIARRYPLVGTGLNTYGLATLFYQEFNLSAHYAQAHNDYLQLAAEGGLLLTVPAAACIAALIVIIRRRFKQEISHSTYWLRAGAVTGLAAMALQETVEFSLQMPGNALLFVVLCAMALHRTPVRTRSSH